MAALTARGLSKVITGSKYAYKNDNNSFHYMTFPPVNGVKHKLGKRTSFTKAVWKMNTSPKSGVRYIGWGGSGGLWGKIVRVV